ncbi:MAG: zinc-ribbon domain-containing protein [Candidatus Lokiarchaeota archaeon]|nr:zinc-ribbon domain-containing protein [Candidatus Lokiarchaeota archaeon]
MYQNQNDRRMCHRCGRNVFPTRPKPNVILAVILNIIYLIYYGLLPKDRCPICYNKVGPIDYAYPPFRGTPGSYDPSMLPKGKVVRTQEDLVDPEGEFLEYIPEEQNTNTGQPTVVKKNFCQFCGAKLQKEAHFCPKCGHHLN